MTARPPGEVQSATRCPTQPSASPAPTWSRYAGASGDHNPIHWTSGSPRSVGLPDVIAHGMFTMALGRSRRRPTGPATPGAVRRARRASSPSRSSCPTRAAPTSRSTGVVKASTRRPARHGRRSTASPATASKVLGMPQGGRPCAEPTRDARRARRRPRPRPRCGSAARPRELVHARPPRTSWSTPSPRPTTPASRCSCSAAAATSSSPTRASPAPSSRSPRRASPTSSPTTDLRRRRRRGRRRRDAGTTLVARAVDAGLGRHRGALRHPGLASGATPIQNVGAYGQEVAQTIARVRVWDRRTAGRAHLRRGRLRLRLPAPAASRRDPGRHVVLDVTFQLRQGDLGAPVRYAELARSPRRRAGRARAAAPTSARPCSACAAARGWCSTPTDHDTWSAGSFFTNPVARRPTPRCPTGAPGAGPQPDGRVKTSAAWLIEQAGFGKGYGSRPGARCPPSTRWR